MFGSEVYLAEYPWSGAGDVAAHPGLGVYVDKLPVQLELFGANERRMVNQVNVPTKFLMSPSTLASSRYHQAICKWASLEKSTLCRYKNRNMISSA